MKTNNSNKINDFHVGDEVIITGKGTEILKFNGKTGKIIKIYNDIIEYPVEVKITETDSKERFRPDEIQLLKPIKDKQYSIFN